MKNFSPKWLGSLLALATIGSLAIACEDKASSSTPATDTAATDAGSDAATGGDAAKTDSGTASDTASGGDTATASDATATTGDAAKTDSGTASDTASGGDTATASDATATTGDASGGTCKAQDKGCLSCDDQKFVKLITDDTTKAYQYAEKIKSCALAQSTNTDQADAAKKIAECVDQDKLFTVSTGCTGCYAIRAHCTVVNCVMNQTEAAKANCVLKPLEQPCTDCANKYKCIEASETCKAGK